MIKKVLMGVGALAVLPALFFGRDASSYFHTAKNNMRDAVKQEIPAEFEVERVRDMVANLVPDIRQCMHVIAGQQVDMEHLQSDIVRREDTVADQEKILLSMTKDLDGGHQEIQYASRTYTSDEVKRDLAVRFDKFKVAKEALQRDRKILKAREKALVANQQKLDNMLSAKQDLEVQIAQLDARLKSIQAAETVSELNFDDSQLAQAKSAIRELNKSLDVKERMLEVEGRFTNLIPTEDVRTVPEDLTSQIQDYLNDSADDQREVLPLETPLALRAIGE
ncbi:hypothetical protein OAK47_02555 [Planctomycetaceae bacterium]|jgi:hypothetical protein|nr:hypothetical protein [Planctomycetaceae bacterium]MDC0273599.1 hypothetical protein [Planctomycetaceae bacterium]MDG2390715.1 hypothetical protein [Planctomycetaceae bacterium]